MLERDVDTKVDRITQIFDFEEIVKEHPRPERLWLNRLYRRGLNVVGGLFRDRPKLGLVDHVGGFNAGAIVSGCEPIYTNSDVVAAGGTFTIWAPFSDYVFVAVDAGGLTIPWTLTVTNSVTGWVSTAIAFISINTFSGLFTFGRQFDRVSIKNTSAVNVLNCSLTTFLKL